MPDWVEPELPDSLAKIVPRGTLDRLSDLSNLAQQWNLRINLVSKASVDAFWHRHIADSLQILPEAKDGECWCDLGSGGGFPGLVIALAAPDVRMTLVESDKRKCAFLMVAKAELGLANLTIADQRIEALLPQNADVVSARAVAPLPTLLGMVARHLALNGRAVLMKGRTVEAEIADAKRHWDFRLERRSSITDADATILVVQDLKRR
jgi:16S rRNA (guanine527-N7)-methyltransferase